MHGWKAGGGGNCGKGDGRGVWRPLLIEEGQKLLCENESESMTICLKCYWYIYHKTVSKVRLQVLKGLSRKNTFWKVSWPGFQAMIKLFSVQELRNLRYLLLSGSLGIGTCFFSLVLNLHGASFSSVNMASKRRFDWVALRYQPTSADTVIPTNLEQLNPR